MTIELLCWVILLMICTSFVLAAFWFIWSLDQTGRDNEVNREVRLTRFSYDDNGNPADFYDPRTGSHFVRSVGNTRYPEKREYLVGNSPIAPVQREKQELPLTVYVGGKPKVETAEPSFTTVPTVHEIGPGTAVPAVNVPAERDFITELSTLKGERVGKERAILQTTGVRKGGSDAWKYWSNIFDQL
jgi:hypothetical protein